MKRAPQAGGRHRAAFFAGFTLLEVMVAVTILGISLVAIFSSEVGAVRNGARARRLTTATLLARCKMGELEEMVMREGLPAVSSRGTDECCEGGEVEGFECEWEIERIVLPDEIMMGTEGEEGEGGALDGLLGGEDPSAAAAGGVPLSGPPSADTLMSGAMLSGGGDPVSEMAMQIAFPILKPAIEEQVRRATVTVRWREGSGDDADEEELAVVQFLVAEQPAAALTNAAADAVLGNPPVTPPVTPPGGN